MAQRTASYRSRLNCRRLEDRWTPALGQIGPWTAAQVRFAAATSADLWQVHAAAADAPAGVDVDIHTTRAVPLSLDPVALANRLVTAPREFTAAARSEPLQISLPKPDGSFALFGVWEIAMMEPGLAAQFPDIKTYRGQGVDDPSATLAMDVTPLGAHVSVLSPNGHWYVDPVFHLQSTEYVAYNRSDLIRTDGATFNCASDANDLGNGGPGQFGPGITPQFSNGSVLKTYRLAVAATGEYTAFHGGTVAKGQAAIVTAVNRVNQVYENDLAVRMTLVSNNSSLVYTDSSKDPYTNGNVGNMIAENQSNVDAVIGNGNYDIGHVVGTNSGGLASLGVVGRTGLKARGATGSGSPINDPFWIDYVAHEMGHQFGGDHTFNGTATDNAAQRNAATAYEPGSGSTIMAYAGIMGSDNLQANSDPYFHNVSIEQILNYLNNTVPTVGSKTNTGNFPPIIATPPQYVIPARTPFIVGITANDSNGDPITVSIEEHDLGAAQALGAGDNGSSPIFRSFAGDTSQARIFPRIDKLAANQTSLGETLPTTNRTLQFTATARDSRAGGGGINTGNISVQVVDTGVAFRVTTANVDGTTWVGGTQQTVTWELAGTSFGTISTPTVRISLSTDGGLTYPTSLGDYANSGNAVITVPNIITSTARLKVTGIKNNYFSFFDINDANIRIGTANLRGTELNLKALPYYRPNLQVYFDFKVSNTEAVASGSFDIGFYASTDSTITTSDRLIGVVNMPPLAAFTTTNPGNVFGLPSQNDKSFYAGGDGFYYVGYVVDYTNKVGETNEGDNANRGFGIDKGAIYIENTADDAYEQNDTRETSSSVLQNAPDVWLSSIAGKGVQHDDDFFKITVPPQATALAHVTAELSYDSSQTTIPLALLTAPFFLGTAFGTTSLSAYVAPGDMYLALGPGPTGHKYDLRWSVGIDDRGPIVKAMTFSDGGNNIANNSRLITPIPGLQFEFDTPLTQATAEDPANWLLNQNGVDISANISSITYTEKVVQFQATRYFVTLQLAAPEGEGQYEVTAGAGILDTDGQPIDGNGDGLSGDAFVRDFRIAYPLAQDPESLVPETTLGDQRRPSVAAAADGSYVVVWEGYGQEGDATTESNVYARRFAANGAPLGAEFRINQYTTSSQSHPAVAMNASGNFIVAWQSDGQDGDGWGTYFRQFKADGTPTNNELIVNAFAKAGNQQHPAVAINAAGKFALVYETNEKVTNGYDIRLADNNFSYTSINQYTTGDQTSPAVGIDASGNYLVTWQSADQDGAGSGVFARGIGTFYPGEFRVNEATALDQGAPAVAVDALGDALVTWSTDGQDGDGQGIYARRYKNFGSFTGFKAQAGEFQVNQVTVDAQHVAAASMDSDGDTVIAWQSKLQDGDGFGVYHRRYSVLGVAQGDEALVNSVTAGDQTAASVALDFDGDYIIAYLSAGQDGDGDGIYARRYSEPPPPPGAPTISASFDDVTTAGGTDYTVSLTITDGIAVDVSTLDNNDLRITGPNGFDVLATFVSVDDNTNGTPRVATYTFTAPGGAWDYADNGVYIGAVETDQIANTVPLFAAAGIVSAFTVAIADTAAPTAVAGLTDVVTAGATEYSFAVTYSDDVAMDVATLDSADVRVLGPGGFDVLATFDSVDDPTNGTPRVATYKFTPPGGDWDFADNATYLVQIEAGQVADVNGNTAVDGTIGTFAVLIPDTDVPTAVGTFDDVTAGGATIYTLTITFADNDAVDVATLDNSDVRVTGPNGFDVLAVYANVDVNTNGTPRVATYTFTPPGLGWSLGDNGSYTVSMEADQVFDVSGNAIAAGALGSFLVDVPDTNAPVINAALLDVTSAGGTTYTFTVTIDDDAAVDVSTLDSDDFRVIGPNGFDVAATFEGVDVNTNGTPRVATYSFTPPGGTWDTADDGPYAVSLQPNQIADTAGNFAPTGVVGQITVAIVNAVAIQTVTVNAGAAQRSTVTSLEVTFDSSVALPANPADAFELKRQSDNAAVTLSAVLNGNTVTITFIGGAVNGDSLADGRYTLTVLASQIPNLDGNADGTAGDDYVLVGDPAVAPELYRFFGDADGDGDVDATDFGGFRQAFGSVSNLAYDFDGDGDVDASDFGAFRQRFGSGV